MDKVLTYNDKIKRKKTCMRNTQKEKKLVLINESITATSVCKKKVIHKMIKNTKKLY